MIERIEGIEIIEGIDSFESIESIDSIEKPYLCPPSPAVSFANHARNSTTRRSRAP